jgi:ribose 5-phosphate isomerase A
MIPPAPTPPQKNPDAQKDAAAAHAVELVTDGMLVGLGTGSTAAFAVKRLGAKVRAGLRIRGVPTSEATRRLASAEGIPLATLDEIDHLDLAIDGADEADHALRLIKGGGGALLREKVVARLARRFIVIADASKLVAELGAFPLPVEVVPFARSVVAREIEEFGGSPSLRITAKGEPFVTDNGNHILDCRFGRITDPDLVAARFDGIPGIADHGLFLGMAEMLVIGQADGGTRILTAPSHRRPRMR